MPFEGCVPSALNAEHRGRARAGGGDASANSGAFLCGGMLVLEANPSLWNCCSGVS